MNRNYLNYCRRHDPVRLRHPNHQIGPSLSQGELLQVYQVAGSTDLRILRETAARMFPERFALTPPRLYVYVGGDRAFQHHGRHVKPVCIIGTPPLKQIGVMSDGMAYPY